MGKDKLKRFAAIKTFANVFEPVMGESFAPKGNWRTSVFKNDNPIILELGCGKGEYAVGMGRHFPNKNFIGVDLKGNRIYIGAKEALQTNLTNVAFLRTRIDFILDYFTEGEVDEIWLTFSDPQPQKARKRLSSPIFTARYKKILTPGGIIHMKTDSDVLFDYTLEQIEEHGHKMLECYPDLYANLPADLDAQTKEIFHIKTYYEEFFSKRGHVIKYCKFRLAE
ncbi:MAG: tRNA (guanosine(46)-N7)-methyltransferase TrmB [Sphingomonadales bacterium]|nr:tRNA (guanosine(46)-N7)-methyltransferase TrmB [Sphingomonadales bacterium]